MSVFVSLQHTHSQNNHKKVCSRVRISGKAITGRERQEYIAVHRKGELYRSRATECIERTLERVSITIVPNSPTEFAVVDR